MFRKLVIMFILLLLPSLAIADVFTPKNLYRIYEIDMAATDQGIATTEGNRTIKDFITTTGTTTYATLVFKNSGTGVTTFAVVTTAINLSSYPNINLRFEMGSGVTVSSGVTTYSPANIIAQPNQQIFSGNGLITFSLSGIVYPQWWGGIPDGGITDNTVPIQSALASINGGAVYISEGDWYITEHLSPKALTTIYGVGKGSRIYSDVDLSTGAAYDDAFFYISNVNNVIIKDLYISGHITNISFGIVLHTAENCIVDNVIVDEVGSVGIYLLASNYNTVSNNEVSSTAAACDGIDLHDLVGAGNSYNKILNNYVHDVKENGIQIYTSSSGVQYGNILSGNTIKDTGTTALHHAFYIRGAPGSVISKNIIKSITGSGIQVYGAGGVEGVSDYSVVTNNIIEDVKAHALYVPATHLVVSGNTIKDCAFTNTGVSGIVPGDYSTVSGNIITNLTNQCYGIYLGCSYSTITENKISKIAYYGIYGPAEAKYNVISNNVITDIGDNAAGNKVGIYLNHAGIGGNLFLGNQIILIDNVNYHMEYGLRTTNLVTLVNTFSNNTIHGTTGTSGMDDTGKAFEMAMNKVDNRIARFRGSLLNMPMSTKLTFFGIDDATPDITTAYIFKTRNANPTTITMFDGGYEGQKIIVLILDANTTFDFTGTNLKGNAGADWAAGNGDWLEAVFDGTNWYCAVFDAA
uniref:Putative pectate lyase n=1 Tax=viral metagenome TaxID=1070528 RepID=A0A6M3KWW4_9ZZZZ